MSDSNNARERYVRAMHAMQAGVAQQQELDPSSMSAKHLRVGLNAARSDLGAIAELLIEKGVFTREEYEKELVRYMEMEKKGYEQQLSQSLGVAITLGSRY